MMSTAGNTDEDGGGFDGYGGKAKAKRKRNRNLSGFVAFLVCLFPVFPIEALPNRPPRRIIELAAVPGHPPGPVVAEPALGQAVGRVTGQGHCHTGQGRCHTGQGHCLAARRLMQQGDGASATG